MRTKNPDLTYGFTLLELVVVLAILAVITTLATREIGHVQDQQRFEAAQRGLEDIEHAILGSPEDRLPDGTRVAAGFVADMGRLPRTTGTNQLTLGELWIRPVTPFDVRAAVQSNGVAASSEDPEVLVPGGWRGPYVRLPLGTDALRDGWGNPYISPVELSPADANGTGYARLRDAGDNALTSIGQEIRIIRHLGANGLRDLSDTGYDRDVAITFSNAVVLAALRGHVEVLNGSSPAVADPADTVTVRVFGPDPDDSGRIRVWSTSLPFASNPVVWEIPATDGLTIGPRVVRAYFNDVNGSGTSNYRKGAVKTVMLSTGVNLLDLQIDR